MLSDAAYLFGGIYVSVLLLGIQSRNAVAGRYVSCAMTSFVIGVAQTVFIRHVAAPGLPEWAVAAVTGFGGSCAITSAIAINRHWLRLTFVK